MSEHEIDLIEARLRSELGVSQGIEGGEDKAVWAARAQAERFWAVTVDRPFIRKPGAWGRFRGMLLAPPKIVMRKLMRWYIEPALAQQRDFNSSILQALTYMNERIDEVVGEPPRAREEQSE